MAFEKRVEGKKAAAKKRATRRSKFLHLSHMNVSSKTSAAARKKQPEPEDSD